MGEAEFDALWTQSAGHAPVSVTEARRLVKEDPKAYKAAVIEGQTPLRDHLENPVVLFKYVGDAQKYLRERLTVLEEQGYKKIRHGITAGIVVLELEGQEVALGIDKPRKAATL